MLPTSPSARDRSTAKLLRGSDVLGEVFSGGALPRHRRRTLAVTEVPRLVPERTVSARDRPALMHRYVSVRGRSMPRRCKEPSEILRAVSGAVLGRWGVHEGLRLVWRVFSMFHVKHTPESMLLERERQRVQERERAWAAPANPLVQPDLRRGTVKVSHSGSVDRSRVVTSKECFT